MKKLILSIVIVLTLNSCTTPDQEVNREDLFTSPFTGVYTKGVYIGGNLTPTTDTLFVIKKDKMIIYNSDIQNVVGAEEITRAKLFVGHTYRILDSINGTTKRINMYVPQDRIIETFEIKQNNVVLYRKDNIYKQATY